MKSRHGLGWLGWALTALIGCGGTTEAVSGAGGSGYSRDNLAEGGAGSTGGGESGGGESGGGESGGGESGAACPAGSGQSAGEAAADIYLSNGSFENGLEGWSVRDDFAEIDTQHAHGGQQSIRLRVGTVGANTYPANTIQSNPLRNLKLNTTYVVSFWYRFENCVGGALVLNWGAGLVPLDGARCDWTKSEFEIYVQDTGETLMVKTGRSTPYPEGCSQDASPCEEFQDNFVWVDDIKVQERGF